MTIIPFQELLLATLMQRSEGEGNRAFHQLSELAGAIGEPDWRRVMAAAADLERRGFVELLFKVRGVAARLTTAGRRHVQLAPWTAEIDASLADLILGEGPPLSRELT